MKKIISILLLFSTYSAFSQSNIYIELMPKIGINYNSGASIGNKLSHLNSWGNYSSKNFRTLSCDAKIGYSFTIFKDVNANIDVGIFNVKSKYKPFFGEAGNRYKGFTTNYQYGSISLGLNYPILTINNHSKLLIYLGVSNIAYSFNNLKNQPKSESYARLSKSNEIDTNVLVVYSPTHIFDETFNIMLEYGINYKIRLGEKIGLQVGLRSGQGYKQIIDGVAYFQEYDKQTQDYTNSLGRSLSTNIGQHIGLSVQLVYYFTQKLSKNANKISFIGSKDFTAKPENVFR